MTAATRSIPCCLNSEMGLLGCCLLSQDAMAAAFDRLPGAEVFYDVRNQSIWLAMDRMVQDNRPIDPITLSEELKRTGVAQVALGLSYIARLTDETPSAANAPYYCDVLIEHYIKRRAIQVADAVISRAMDSAGMTADELVSHLQLGIVGLTDIAARRETMLTLQDLAPVVIEDIERAFTAQNGLFDGIATGWSDLDEILGGLKPGHLYTVGGRPSTGKTALACCLCEKIALESATPVGFISLEMPSREIAKRILAANSRTNLSDSKLRYLTEQCFSRMSLTVTRMRHAPLVIDDEPSVSLSRLGAKARKMVKQHSIRLLIVDYLQIVESPGKSKRHEEVAAVARGLKNLARELHIPIFALAQISRDVERDGRRPSMRDLRESGDIEAAADSIILLHTENDPSDLVRTIEAIVPKNRAGRTGIMRFTFRAEFTRFDPQTSQPC